jgi:hypothetical protein
VTVIIGNGLALAATTQKRGAIKRGFNRRQLLLAEKSEVAHHPATLPMFNPKFAQASYIGLITASSGEQPTGDRRDPRLNG